MREIILDTETTGLNPEQGHRLVEIGCVEIINRFVTGKTFHRYINPERLMPTEAFNIHGLSDEFLSDKPIFSLVVDEFLEFIAEDTLVIHNASFDMNFINSELKKLGKEPLVMGRVVDTLTMARRKYPGSPASLDALCNRFGINNAHRTKHGALLDSEILAEIYVELMGGKQSSLGLMDASHATNAGNQQDNIIQSNKRSNFSNKTLITPEELEAHRHLIEEMKEKAVWRKYLNP